MNKWERMQTLLQLFDAQRPTCSKKHLRRFHYAYILNNWYQTMKKLDDSITPQFWDKRLCLPNTKIWLKWRRTPKCLDIQNNKLLKLPQNDNKVIVGVFKMLNHIKVSYIFSGLKTETTHYVAICIGHKFSCGNGLSTVSYWKFIHHSSMLGMLFVPSICMRTRSSH